MAVLRHTVVEMRSRNNDIVHFPKDGQGLAVFSTFEDS